MVGPLRRILKHGFYDPLLARKPGPQVGKMSGRANRNALIRSSAQDCCSGDIGGSRERDVRGRGPFLEKGNSSTQPRTTANFPTASSSYPQGIRGGSRPVPSLPPQLNKPSHWEMSARLIAGVYVYLLAGHEDKGMRCTAARDAASEAVSRFLGNQGPSTGPRSDFGEILPERDPHSSPAAASATPHHDFFHLDSWRP